MVRERELDEFGSLFQRSIIPAIEVERIEVRELVVLADFSDRAETCARAARELADRFGARVSVRFLLHPSDRGHDAEARARMEKIPADEHRLVEGDPLEHLRSVTEEERPSMILAPAPLRVREAGEEAAAALGEFVDRLLVSTAIPTLLVRRATVESLFTRILAKIPGGRHDLIQQFSFAFALCPPGGSIRLLHVVDGKRLAELAEALELSPGIDTEQGGEELLAAIRARMDRLLRGAVRTARDAAFDVEALVEVGDPFEVLPRHAEDASLLIVGSVASHREFLSSRAYELIRRVPDVPVLAL